MKRDGFSLLELMIAIAILAILISMIYLMVMSSSDQAAAGSVDASLNAEARDLLDRLSAELIDGGVSTFQPAFPNASTTLAFRRNIGFANQQVTFGGTITYAFVYEPGELNNGIDDNGDGRIDEGRLVRTENGDSVVICRDLAENGITFTQSGNTVRIILTLQKLDPNRRVLTYTRETTIQVRN